MGKKANFLVVLSILLLIAALNIYLYFDKVGKTETGVSGFSIKQVSSNLVKLDFSTIIFVVQWVLILLVVFIFYVKFLKRKKEETKKSLDIKIEREKGSGKTHTDLDDFYDLLKEKKHLKVSDISRIFKLNAEKALEWCKILESHNLASLEYPAFSEPEVIIKV